MTLNAAAHAEPSVRFFQDQYGGFRVERQADNEFPRIAGEFEPQRFLMLSVCDWKPHHQQILIELAIKTQRHCNLLILCKDAPHIAETTKWLLSKSNSYPNVYFGIANVDTVWVRDFGPIFAQTNSGADALDFLYEGTRPKDDQLPRLWSQQTQSKHRPIPWTMQGGNLLCNGNGLALTTTRIFKDNYITFPASTVSRNPEVERRTIVMKALVEACNLKTLAVLEPLQNEATSHVDLFATFVSPRDVVVAKPTGDFVNSGILERNVQRLRAVKVNGQPLKIHRVQIPQPSGRAWSSYTNIVIANDLVLLPRFDSDPPPLLEAAKRTYKRLLPDHTIETIDMTSMKQLQGALHCLSSPVPAFVPYQQSLYTFESASRKYFPKRMVSETQDDNR